MLYFLVLIHETYFIIFYFLYRVSKEYLKHYLKQFGEHSLKICLHFILLDNGFYGWNEHEHWHSAQTFMLYFMTFKYIYLLY